METVQTNHVCDLVFPCEADASQVAVQAVKALQGNGLFGVELFETSDGKILVNEIAPRPHNSGHYTLDWGGPSQFEAHVRLAMGWPQITPRSNSYAVMANLLGQEGAGPFQKGVPVALAIEGVFVHWYGKENRPGRKMGHLNVVGATGESVQDTTVRAIEARNHFYRQILDSN
jgi:5-(carboxyamino)imidazole ribonucleotide synthase